VANSTVTAPVGPGSCAVLVAGAAGPTRAEATSVVRALGYRAVERDSARPSLPAIRDWDAVIMTGTPRLDRAEMAAAHLVAARAVPVVMVAAGRPLPMPTLAWYWDWVPAGAPPGELGARLERALRCRTTEAALCSQVLGYVRATRAVSFTPSEQVLLDVLCHRAGTVVSGQGLAYALWGADLPGSPHLLSVHVSALRRKLRDASVPLRVRNQRGLGWVLTVQPLADR